MHVLRPSEMTLKKWFSLVPTEADLVFFKNRAQAEEFQSLQIPLYTFHEVNVQSADLMGLNERSWYGYSLGQAAFCMKLPAGVIESLEPRWQRRLLQIQRKIQVPTLVRSRARGFPRHDSLVWITAQSWRQSPTAEKLKVLKAYYEQNPRIEKYPRLPLQELSVKAKDALKEYHLQSFVHEFARHSGPNCFALVAQAFSPHPRRIAEAWLHWPPLKRFLLSQGFRKTSDPHTRKGDVLVLMSGTYALHGSLALDENFVIEKPGQDFYEPYLISSLKKPRPFWRNTTLHRWRRDS